MKDITVCLFCNDSAVAIYYMAEGCVCKSNKIQPLCLHHEAKAQPLGNMILVFDYRPAPRPAVPERSTDASPALE